MSDRRFQIAGLLGFIVSGLTFMISGVKSGDALTIFGSFMWVLACVIWLIPLVKPSRD